MISCLHIETSPHKALSGVGGRWIKKRNAPSSLSPFSRPNFPHEIFYFPKPTHQIKRRVQALTPPHTWVMRALLGGARSGVAESDVATFAMVLIVVVSFVIATTLMCYRCALTLPLCHPQKSLRQMPPTQLPPLAPATAAKPFVLPFLPPAIHTRAGITRSRRLRNRLRNKHNKHSSNSITLTKKGK